MRDDFTEEVKRALAARVGYCCSNPYCNALTSGPQDDPAKAVNVGVAAHITAAASGGPRYDSALSSEERRSVDNGIWLCQNCAHIVDSDVARFDDQLLRAWKLAAEDRARNSLGRTAVEKQLPELELYLELEGVKPHTYDPRTTPVRVFELGIRNVGNGTAKFPSLRYKRASGLVVDNFGIDGSFGFGLPRTPTDGQWETFRGGADHVIHSGDTLKITKLIQNGSNTGKDGLPLPKIVGPHGQSRSQWVFGAMTFEFEIAAEGTSVVSSSKEIPGESVNWPLSHPS